MSETLPAWYLSLVQLKPLITAGDWDAIHKASKALIKQLYAKAPTVKNYFETVVLLTMNASITEEQKQQITKAYNQSLHAAQKELDTPDFDRIVKEEEIADRLDIVNGHISTSWRIVWNYWRGEKGADYIEWKDLGKELKITPMTRIGRLRLQARYNNVSQRVSPSFGKMIVQLWPLALLWVIKKVAPLLLSSLFKTQLEKRKAKKQALALKSKLGGKEFSIASLKKATGQRSKRRSRRKRT